MVITMQQLKTQPSRIFGKVNKGQEMAISYKGKICAKIVPLNVKLADNEKNSDNELFGMWKDRDDIGDASQYVRLGGILEEAQDKSSTHFPTPSQETFA